MYMSDIQIITPPANTPTVHAHLCKKHLLLYMKLMGIMLLYVSGFINQLRLVRNETLIWNFIGSL